MDLQARVVGLWDGSSDLERLWSARLPFTVTSWDGVEVLWENVVDLVVGESLEWMLVADVKVAELPFGVELDTLDGNDCHRSDDEFHF